MKLIRRQCTPRGRAVVFMDLQPRPRFQVGNIDHATLQLAAQQDERKRIAQELHDTLLQGFTAIALKLDALAGSLPPGLSKTKAQLQNALAEMDQYLAEARRSIWKLRSAAFESAEEFSQALARVSERALAGTGIALGFSLRGVAHKLEEDCEDNLLRICEEAVANAAKHARSTHVEVSLQFHSDCVQLCIQDNGRGFDPAGAAASKKGHFGLVGIKERVAALSGALSIESAPKRGTRMEVTVVTNGKHRCDAREEPTTIAMRTHCV